MNEGEGRGEAPPACDLPRFFSRPKQKNQIEEFALFFSHPKRRKSNRRSIATALTLTPFKLLTTRRQVSGDR